MSPLKALAVDIHQNLERPLREIAETARALGLAAPVLTVAVRTGDTPSSARAAMLRVPPTFLVTTPESLYLLLTSVLALLASLGVSVLFFQEVLGWDGLTYFVPFVVAVLLVSLGADYSVFLA